MGLVTSPEEEVSDVIGGWGEGIIAVIGKGISDVIGRWVSDVTGRGGP